MGGREQEGIGSLQAQDSLQAELPRAEIEEIL